MYGVCTFALQTKCKQIMSDLYRQMYDALACDEVAHETVTIDINDQKSYVCKHVNKLSLDTKRAFLRLLVLGDLSEELQWVNDGTLINLDRLEDNVVQQLYTFVQYHIEK